MNAFRCTSMIVVAVLCLATGMHALNASPGDRNPPPSSSNRLEAVTPDDGSTALEVRPMLTETPPIAPAFAQTGTSGGTSLGNRGVMCFCGLDTSGEDFCFPDTGCGELVACTSNADCPAGERCLADNCCAPPVNFACHPECIGGCVGGSTCDAGYEPCGPTNDDCEYAEWLDIPSEVQAWTTDAYLDYAPICQDVSNTAPGIWYRVIGTGYTITVSTCTEFCNFDTKLSVYCPDCEHLFCAAANDNNCEPYTGLESTVSWCSEPGMEYLILLHGYGSATGGCMLSVWDDGRDCSDPPDCSLPDGACCAPWGCTEGFVCNSGSIPLCNGTFLPCVCFTTYDGDLACIDGMQGCGQTCPNGTECPAGSVCVVNSCCNNGSPTCVIEGCPLEPGFAPPPEPQGSGLFGDAVLPQQRAPSQCAEMPPIECEYYHAYYYGDGISCADVTCPEPYGACCYWGECLGVMEEAYCLEMIGTWYPGEDCSTVDCPPPPPTGACCVPPVCDGPGTCPFENCGGNWNCYCFGTAEGQTFCAGNFSCWNTACPNGSSDCGPGEVCFVDTCCPDARCGPEECTMFKGDPDDAEVPTASGHPLGGNAGAPAELECMVISRATCLEMDGTYLGDDVSCVGDPCAGCDVICPGIGIPEDEPDCGLPDDTTNGGCNSYPPVFTPIACGETYCGGSPPN